MSEKDEDLQVLIQDVKTIKAILNGTDAPLPQFWKVLIPGSVLLVLAGILRFCVPALRSLNFLEVTLWYWAPAAILFAMGAMTFIFLEFKRTGKGFIHQNRVQNLLFARFIVPPGLLTLAFVYSQSNQPYSFEGVMLLLLSIWLTVISPLLPLVYRIVPVSFLTLGLLEILFNLRGDGFVLANTLVLAAAPFFAAILFWQMEADRRRQEAPRV